MRCVFLASLIALFFVDSAAATDWTGFYAGVFGGAAWTDVGTSASLAGEWGATPAERAGRDMVLQLLNHDLSTVGAIGGLAVGVNAQSGSFVDGIEVDASVLDSDSGYTLSTPSNLQYPYVTETKASLDWLGTARLRAGWSFDRTLVYGTGGIAVGHVSFRQDIVEGGNVPYKELGRVSDAAFGWVVGGGIEQALTEHWSFKAQYLHVDLGAISTTSSGACSAACSPANATSYAKYTGDHKADVTVDTATAGIDYRF